MRALGFLVAAGPIAGPPGGGMTILRQLTSLLGVFAIPPEKKTEGDDGFADGLMGLVLELRAEARASKNWGMSDKIRNKLKELKVVVQDRPDGTATWKRE